MVVTKGRERKNILIVNMILLTLVYRCVHLHPLHCEEKPE